MKTITIILSDGSEVSGEVVRENDDNSQFWCIDDKNPEGMMFEVQITVED